MEDSTNKNNQPDKNTTKNKKKLLLRIAVAVFAVFFAIGVFFLIDFFIKQHQENVGIKVGDVVITKKQIKKKRLRHE